MKAAFENLEKLSAELYQKLIADAESEIEKLKEKAALERNQLMAACLADIEQHKKRAQRNLELDQEKQLRDLQHQALALKEKLKHDLQHFISDNLIHKPISEAFNHDEFIRNLVLALANQFDPTSYRISWPEEWNTQLLSKIRESLAQWSFEVDGKKALRIMQKDQGMEIQFSAESFERLLKDHFEKKLLPLLFSND